MQKSQTSLSVSQQGLANQSAQSGHQDISQKSATSQSNISNISRNISRDYVGSSPQNRLTQTFLDKFKGKFSERFREIYNQSISQSQSSSQLLSGQALSGANFSVANSSVANSSAIIAGAGSLESVQGENPDDQRRRPGSPGKALRRDAIHPFASGAGVSSTTIRPLGIRGLNLERIVINDALDLSSVAPEPEIGRGSGRGHNIDTPRIQSAPTTARGPGSGRIQEVPPTNRSASHHLEIYNESPGQFKDSIEDDDQNLTNLIEKFILETPVQDSVSQSLDQSQNQLQDYSLDQSQDESPKKLISRELEKIKQARIVGLMKQKFSEFKVKFQKSNPPNLPQKINPDLYRKFLFETDENGNDLQPPRPAGSKAKITVPEIFKALAICLVEAENNPNDIVGSPQNTESSPQSAKSDNSSIISSRSDYGGNAMTVILKILNDQKQLNLGSENLEKQLDSDQLTSHQENSFNQDQEGKIINSENFAELLQRLGQIVSHKDEREGVDKSLLNGVGGVLESKVTADVEIFPHKKLESSLFYAPTKLEPGTTLKSPQALDSLDTGLETDPQNSSDSNEAEGEGDTTPPSSPAPAQQKGSPGAQAALDAGIVSMVRNSGGFSSMVQGDSDSEGYQAGGGEIKPLNHSRKALFEKVGSQNTSPDQSRRRPPAKIISIQKLPATVPVKGIQNELIPFTATALYIPPQKKEDSPPKSPLYPASEKEGQEPKPSPASSTSTAFAGGGSPANSGHSPTASLQTASPQELSPVATLNSLTSSPVSGSLEGLASDSETASHPSSPALAGGPAGGSGSDLEIASRSNSPVSAGGSAVSSADGSAVGSAGWAVREAQADQVLFEYSIITQDHQDDVNYQPNPKKDYNFFIQKSQDHEGEITNNEKTKIAIKFKESEDDGLPMTDTIKENQAKELVKNAINRAIEETKKLYPPDSQNSTPQEDQIYYDYLEIAIDVGGVKNKADEFKEALRKKFKQENTVGQIEEDEIEKHFKKAQLLSENFQKIAKNKFGIFTGRIGEARSRVVGMRTKRIPIDLLNEVRREKLSPSNSPSDTNDSPLTCNVMFHPRANNL